MCGVACADSALHLACLQNVPNSPAAGTHGAT